MAWLGEGEGEEEGEGGGGRGAGGGERDLDLDLGADLKAHRPPGEEHDGVPDDSAYRPAMGGRGRGGGGGGGRGRGRGRGGGSTTLDTDSPGALHTLDPPSPVPPKVFKYLIKNIPRHGPIYHEAYKLEEKCEQFDRAMEIVEKGLVANPRYGPLWFGAFRLHERMALQEQLVVQQQTYADHMPSAAQAPVHPGHRHVRCMQCTFVPSGAHASAKDPAAAELAPGLPAPLPAPAPHSPVRRPVRPKGEDAPPPASPSSSAGGSRDSSPHPSPRVLEDAETSSSVGDSGMSACDSARSNSTSLSAASCGHPPGPHLPVPRGLAARVPVGRAREKEKEKAPQAARGGPPPFCELCCPHTRSLESAAALAAEAPRPIPIDLTRVRDAIGRAVKSISKELVWKVFPALLAVSTTRPIPIQITSKRGC